MQLLSVQRARSIWLFDTYDLNPRGKDIGSTLIDWLKTKYQFTKVPANVNDLDETKALCYTGGQFRVGRESVSVELRIYGDGVVGDTRSSTEDTDFFLSDVLQSAAKEFGLPYTQEIIRKQLYVSELTVRTDKTLPSVNPKMAEFARKLGQAIGATSSPELASIAFWPDVLPSPAAAIFKFERKWGAEFSENRYYARAPLQTSKHLEILQDLEAAIS